MDRRQEHWKVRFYRFMLGSHPDDCWPWVGATTGEREPYGIFTISGKNILAHRVAWEIHRGPIPEGLVLCHRCDNTLCCNHHHLFLGTPKENSMDRQSKGRGHLGGRTAALTTEQVGEIRETTTGTRALAAKFGTTRDTIQRVRRGLTYNGNPGKFARKVTASEVVAIRARAASGEYSKSLATDYGLHVSTVRCIVQRRTWKHVP